MNPLPDELVARLGMALLHSVWQGALIGCACAAALAMLRNARPQARYALCCAAMLACIVWPMSDLVMPLPAEPIALPWPPAPPSLDAMAGTMHRNVLTLTAATLQPGLPTIVLLWAIGALAMSLRLTLGLAWVQRLGARARAAGHPVDPTWQARLAALGRRMGVRRLPLLRVLDDLDGPVTIGRWRPLILLPASLLTHMPPEMLEALLAHELAHIRRFDHIANLVQCVVEALLFHHPVVWWLSRRIRAERELIADDLAAEALGGSLNLARALSELARLQSTPTPWALAARGGSLVTRIRRLIRPTHQPLGWRLALPLAGLTALAIAAQATGLTPAAPQAARSAPSTPSTPSTPASPASPASPVGDRIARSDTRQPFAFALLTGREGHTIMSGDEKDLREATAQLSKTPGDLLWVRQGGQRYIVTDPAAVAEARALWSPVQAFDADMEALGRQMEAKAAVLERHAREIEAVHEAPMAEMQALQSKMEDVRRQHDKVRADVDKLSRKIAATKDEKKLAQLEPQLEPLEATLEPLEASMQALGEQMERIGERHEKAMDQLHSRHDQDVENEMEALSRQMESLSQQQEAAAKLAEQRMGALIQDLIQRGVARQG